MLTLTHQPTTQIHPTRVTTQRLTTAYEDDVPSPAPEPLIDRYDLLYLVKKNLRVLIAVPLVFALVGIAFFFFKEPSYKSTALIYIDPKIDQILRFEKLEGGSPSNTDSLSSLEIMIMADSMVLRVAEKLDLRNQPGCLPADMASDPNLPDQKLVRFLQKNRFSAELTLGTRLLKITVSDPDPERARLIASSFVSEFDTFLIEQRQSEARKARTILEKQVVEARDAALDGEKVVREFRESHPQFPVEQDHDMFAARLTQFSNDLNSVVSHRMELETQLEFLQNLAPDTPPTVIVEVTGFDSSSHVSDLLNLHAASSARLAAAEEQMGASNPKLQAIRSEFLSHDNQLRDLAVDIKLATAKKFEATLKREEGLETQLETVKKELVEMKSLSSEFRAVQEQAERQWLIHGTLQTRLSESVLALDSSSNIATEVSQPMRPYKKASPNYFIVLIVAGGLGTLFGASWIGTKALAGLPYTHRVQLERHGLPLIADWTSPNSLPAPGEAAVFLHALGANRAKTISILSPDLPGTAGSVADLAAQMTAGNSERTLLVSIRPNPQKTGKKSEPKFSETGCLSKLELTPQEAMQRQSLENYLGQFGHLFQHIILEAGDCPETEMSQWLACLADQNVIVVGQGSSSKRSVDSTISALTSHGMPPLGLIVVDPDLCPIKATSPIWKRLPETPQQSQFAHSA